MHKNWGSQASVNEPITVKLQEFVNLIQTAGVVTENFGSKEIGPLFNISMMTNVDEIFSERHMQMKVIEFVEAIARIADKTIKSL